MLPPNVCHRKHEDTCSAKPKSGLEALTLLHIKVWLPVQLCAVKTVEGDFPFCWTTTPNVGQTHKENPNLVRILYMVCTLIVPIGYSLFADHRSVPSSGPGFV